MAQVVAAAAAVLLAPAGADWAERRAAADFPRSVVRAMSAQAADVR
ncbi:hypothetical protein [Pandoraea norimbergensis]